MKNSILQLYRKNHTRKQTEKVKKISSHIQCEYAFTAFMKCTGSCDAYYNTVGETLYALWGGDFSIRSICGKDTSYMTNKELKRYIKMLRKLKRRIRRAFRKAVHNYLRNY